MQNEPNKVSTEWLYANKDKLAILVENGEAKLQWCLDYLGKHEESERERVKEHSEIYYREWRDSSIKYFQERYTQSTNYTNLIMVAGYAGFFGLWNMMEDNLIPLYHSLTGICFVFSLFFFVFGEVFAMREEYYRNKKFVETEKDGNIVNEMSNFNSIEKEFGDRNEHIWKWHFYPAVSLGLIGVAFLFGDLLGNLGGELWTVLQ
jgi:hypothetical protein